MIDKDWEEKLMKNTISHGTGFMRMSLNKNGGIDVDVVDPTDYRFCIKEPQIQVSFNSEVVGYVDPQREWVGLTDEDILAVNMSTVTKLIDDPIVCDTNHNIIQLGKAIEAKLKEKNT
jgi:hypothetical protein